jgi:hypothetical protein
MCRPYIFCLISIAISWNLHGQLKPWENYNHITYQDFIAGHFSHIESYTYTLKRNGKIKDSTFLFWKTLDTFTGILTGKIIPGKNIYRVKSPNYFYTKWKTEYQRYDSRGRLSEENSVLRTWPREGQRKSYAIIKSYKYYTYNDMDSVIFEKSCGTRFSIKWSKKDSVFKTSQYDTVLKVYEYNNAGKKVSEYIYRDGLSGQRKDTIEEWGYGDNGLLKTHVMYGFEGIERVTHYTYAQQNDLLTIIDSLGFPLYKEDPSEITTRTNYYTGNLLSGYIIKLSGTNYYTIQKFDQYGSCVSYCLKLSNESSCEETIFAHQYNNGLLISTEVKSQNDSYTIFYKYSKGLLAEKRRVYKGKVKSLIRYYYH